MTPGGVNTPETAATAPVTKQGYSMMFQNAATFPDQQTRVVLRIDDNPDDLLLFQLAWEKSRNASPIHCTTSRKEAVDYLEGRGKFGDRDAFPLPAIIIIDMRLPDGNASEFLKWLRAHPKLSRLVVVVLSGTAQQEDVNEAYRSGANSFLLKSASSRHLHDTVKLIQSYWLGQNLPPSFPQAASF